MRKCLVWIVVVGVLLAAHVQAQATWYVATSGAETAAGTNWATAFRSITNGVAHAAGGDTVLVSNGTYYVSATNLGSGVVIASGITLQSLNGPAATILSQNTIADGTLNFRILELTAAASGAIVSGFTIRDGISRNDRSGGAGVQMAAGTVTNCIVRDNSARRSVPTVTNHRMHGGGAIINGGTMINCQIINNDGNDYNGARGGGVYMSGGLLKSCVVTNNNGSPAGVSDQGLGGGGVYFEAGGTADTCVISYNVSPLGGGVCLVGGGTVRNCLINDNTYGAGAYMTAGTLESCTIARNSADWYQTVSGVSMTGGSMLNCIVWGNQDGYNPRFSVYWDPVSNTVGTVTYCVLQKTVSGTGNVVTNPLYVSQSGGDFRLATNSPAINTGSSQGWMAGATDLSGNPRIVGATVDVGAYEEDGTIGPLRAHWDATPMLSTNTMDVQFTSGTAGSNLTGATYYWTFGDGGVSNLAPASVNHTYSPGIWTVSLLVSNAAGERYVASTTNALTVLTDLPVYVSTNGGNVRPYTNWANASRDLVDAVALASSHVIVSNGTYSLNPVSNGAYSVNMPLQIDKSILLESVNGPNLTTVRVVNAINTRYPVLVVLSTATGAVVSGFTIRDGYTGILRAGGSGVQLYAGTVTNCDIRNNTAVQPPTRNNIMAGCGASVYGGLLVNCVIRDNAGGDYVGCRGALYMRGGAAVGCVISNNNVGSGTTDASALVGGGGGVCLEGGGLVDRCIIVSNTAWFGGGAYVLGGTLRSSLIRDSCGGSGVLMTSGVVENCTIVKNTAGASGFTYSGLSMSGGATRNSIVYLNAGGNAVEKTGGSFDYCHSESPIAGVSNSVADPSFVDQLNGNYRLAAGSTCIETGTNLAWVATSYDLEGNPRLIGPIVDRGAYENNAALGPLTCSFAAVPLVGNDSLVSVFTASLAGSNTTGVSYYWDLGNGAQPYGPDKAVVTNSYTPGLYTISLSATNVLGEGATKVRVGYILVRTANTVYVSKVGSQTAPFTNWATAATNIQSAVDQASSLVIVSNGTYDITAEIAIARPITLRSLNGRAVTMVRLASGIARVFNMTTNGVIDGFTIANGNTGGSGGGVLMTAGTVQYCSLTNNRAGAGGGGVYMFGGLVQNCIVLRNWAAGGGDGCGGVQMTGSSKLRNSLITANEGVDRAGGVRIHSAACEVDNCTVVGNYGGYNYAGILADVGGTTVRNIIAIDNKNGGGVQQNFNVFNGAAAIYSCGPDVLAAGAGNVTNAPGFERNGSGSPGTNFVAGDYHLQPISPCVNAGTNLYWIVYGVLDLDGRGRVSNRRVDMGAYEEPPSGTVFYVR